MICYVLTMGKQHLGPHVVVGYGIKIFWPGLFITSPDHLAVATRLWKMQFISVYLYIYLLPVRAHLTFSETYKRGKVNHLFYASYSRPILILLYCGGIYSGKRRVTITNKNNTLSPCPSRSKTSSYFRASTRGVGRSLSSEKDGSKLRRIGIVLSQGWCSA